MSTTLRALVVYESMFGNTEQVALAVVEGLSRENLLVEAHDVRDVPADATLDVDLLVVGAPTHAFSLSRPSTRADAVRQGAPNDRAELGLREWLANAPGRPGLPVAVFDTRAAKARRLPMTAGRRAAKMAVRRGFRLLTKPAGFAVDDLKGPLEPRELERAERWGETIAGLARLHFAGNNGGLSPR